jgi:hypothetical protein
VLEPGLVSSVSSPIGARQDAGKLFSLPDYPADRAHRDIGPSLWVLLTSTGDQVCDIERKLS